MKTLLAVIGTRPEAIKMAPAVAAFRESTLFRTHLLLSGQHKNTPEEILSAFGVRFDEKLVLCVILIIDLTLRAYRNNVVAKIGDGGIGYFIANVRAVLDQICGTGKPILIFNRCDLRDKLVDLGFNA